MSEINRGKKRLVFSYRPKKSDSAKARTHSHSQQFEKKIEEIGDNVEPTEVFDKKRFLTEIEKAETIAAQKLSKDNSEINVTEEANAEIADTHEDTVVEKQTEAAKPLPEKEEPYKMVEIEEPVPKGFINKIKYAADKIISKIENIIRPTGKVHKEIIINAESLETRVAVLEDGRLEEFTIERVNEERLVGSIFKGKVRNLEDGLKAAFVDIGYEKNAFLHYWDIIPSNLDSNYEVVEREGKKKDREKPRITQKDIPRLYPVGSDIVVQVTKGPIGTKGPRVTTNLVLPGRFLVLLPNSEQCGISRKIEDPEERQRLKKILKKLNIPEGMGVIIRTAGEGQQYRYFVRDLALLVEEWKAIQERIEKLPAPACVFKEPDLIERSVRDFLTEDVERVVIDDSKAFERIKQMVARISPRSVRKIKLYTEPIPIFDKFNITRQLDEAFSRRVNLKSGGYIVIDETEALVAIDVNTGKHKTDPKELDSTILKVNLEAADEICRQLRLRNMGGVIVLDFIDMKSRRDQQAVYNRMKQNLRRDRAKTHILPISQLGLMEMTRQRHTESVRESIYDDCPYCAGKGKVKSTLTMSVEIQRKLVEILKKRLRDEMDFNLKVVAHPIVIERLETEDEKLLIDLEKKYFCKILLHPDPGLHIEEFIIYNEANNEVIASHELKNEQKI
jgi:ribonuclease G